MALRFNKLSEAEEERLTLLAEECAEVIQIVCKIKRHGYRSRHPAGGPVNRELLEKEMGDVEFAMNLLAENHDVSAEAISQHSGTARIRKKKYLHHQ